MQEYIIELSKYFIAAFMILYTLVSLLALCQRKNGKTQGVSAVQTILMFLIQVLCFLDLTLVSRDVQYLFFFAFIMLFQFAAITMVSLIYDRVNHFLLNNMCMLLGTGLCMVSRLSFQKAIKQYVIVVISLMISLLIPFLIKKIRFFKKLTWVYAAVGIGLLSVVLVLGEITHGSKISFSVGGVTFQPSEFVKILYVFFLAGALWEKTSLGRVVLTAILAGAHVIILVVSKDLGSALIFFVTYVMMLYVATKKPVYLLAAAGCAVVASVGAYYIFSHIQVRVQAWRDPWSVINDAGYQIAQSMFAICSGGMFGLGLYGGTPGDIPYVETDFIFSAMAEELGILFCICLIMVYISCFIMFMNIAVRVKDRFYQLVAFGLGVTYGFQIFLTVGGGTKFIPLTGVTLPLISYGGSSVLATLIMFAVVEGIYCIRQVGGKGVVRKKTGTTRETKTEAKRQTE